MHSLVEQTALTRGLSNDDAHIHIEVWMLASSLISAHLPALPSTHANEQITDRCQALPDSIRLWYVQSLQ